MTEQEINTEVLGVLMALGNEYVSLIPENILEYLLLTSDVDNIPKIDANKRIEEQNISQDARAFLVMLKLQYWCKNEEEKRKLIEIIDNNEKEQQNKLNQKYNNKEIFNNKNIAQSFKKSENAEIINIEKENIIQKIIKKIKKFLLKY